MSPDDLIRTNYTGKVSFHLPTIDIRGTPRSGRENDDISADEKRLRREWVRSILSAVRKYDSPIPVDLPIESECNLFVTFYLSEVTKESGSTRYSALDLDNLLKPLQDTLMGKIIKDDSLFIGVKVRKERVNHTQKEGVSLSVVTTKSLTIKKVEQMPGNHFIEYWKTPAQFITATDEDGVEGTFIDHPPNVFLRDQYESNLQYRDLVPGYCWEECEGKKVSGCMVVKRRHHFKEEDHEKKFSRGKVRNLHWLHKWDW